MPAWLRRLSRLSRRAWVSASTMLSGSGMSTCSSTASSVRSLAWPAWPARRICSSCLRVPARSSPMVSNSLADWANSSSSTGSSLTFTLLTVTWTSAAIPASWPPASSEVNVVVSPADMPIRASSRPSSMLPEPTS